MDTTLQSRTAQSRPSCSKVCILDQTALITAASALPPGFDHSALSVRDQSRCMRLHFTGLDFNNNRNSTRRSFHKPGSVIIDCRFEGMRRYVPKAKEITWVRPDSVMNDQVVVAHLRGNVLALADCDRPSTRLLAAVSRARTRRSRKEDDLG